MDSFATAAVSTRLKAKWFGIARLAPCASLLVSTWPAGEPAVPILVYYRLSPVHADSTIVTTQHFREQLDLLVANEVSIIPLSRFSDWRLGRASAPPPASVVFIYPSCISHAPYAMTWDQVKHLAANPSFDIGSHTFCHPNFKMEKTYLSASRYEAFIDAQLKRSKEVLGRESGRPVDSLAWPFSMYDRFLMLHTSAARCLTADEYVGPVFSRLSELRLLRPVHKND